MSYLVLARKWRPKRFAELVGQEHVVRALSHALDSGRVHHAFLFTGTRGVGKTTIARIFAKSLNCERGIGAEPCGECAVCTSVDAGRFVDLIEIDAASNTGVDDVREVIENAQYMPTRGRYKVYLVDEVHMLSRNAFNALLKTLEEPPEHVKFLLATTDPQKLPVTVLSRCLQFNLKRLTPEQIDAQMRHILAAEGIEFDARSIGLLTRGADGSLRDGLSLLDQAIAYGSGVLRGEEVAQMLGSVEHGDIEGVLGALAADDGAALVGAIEHLAGFSPDFSAVLDTLASALHQVQLRQLVPAAAGEDSDAIRAAAARPAELIALWYQMAVSGRRELDFAPSPRIGFEMILLRMLAFSTSEVTPPGERAQASAGGGRAAAAAAIASLTPAAPAAAREAANAAPARPWPAPEVRAPIPAPAPAAMRESRSEPEPAVIVAPIELKPVAPVAPVAASASTRRAMISDSEDWLDRIAQLGLRGPASQLVAHAQYLGDDGNVLRLALPEVHEHLKVPSLVEQLAKALGDVLGAPPRIEFGHARSDGPTLHARHQRERDERQTSAEAAFVADPTVQRWISEYGATVVPGSIRPV